MAGACEASIELTREPVAARVDEFQRQRFGIAQWKGDIDPPCSDRPRAVLGRDGEAEIVAQNIDGQLLQRGQRLKSPPGLLDLEVEDLRHRRRRRRDVDREPERAVSRLVDGLDLVDERGRNCASLHTVLIDNGQ